MEKTKGTKKSKRKKITNLGPVIKVSGIHQVEGGVKVEAVIETLESKTVTFEFHTLDFDPNEVSSAFVSSNQRGDPPPPYVPKVLVL